MKQEQLIEIINRAWNVRHNSLAAYILSAGPYVETGKENLLQAVKQVAEVDQTLAATFAAAFDELPASPHAMPYEPFVSELNYLSIQYLVGVLKEKLTEELARLEADWKLVAGSSIGEKTLAEAIAGTKKQIELLT